MTNTTSKYVSNNQSLSRRTILRLLQLSVLLFLPLSAALGCSSDNTPAHQKIPASTQVSPSPKTNLLQPISVALHPHGGILITDSGNNRIVWQDDTGQVKAVWGKKGTQPGEFLRPLGIDVSPDNKVYVADSLNDRIQILDLQGNFLAEWKHLPQNDKIFAPADLTVTPSGDVFVIEFNGARVLKFTPTGQLLLQWGTQGHSINQFYYPTGIKSDPNGLIWVSDAYNHRIQVFTPDGTFLAAYGNEGTSPGQFKTSGGLDFDPNGNPWIADFENNRIQRFSPVTQVNHSQPATQPATQPTPVIWSGNPAIGNILHPTSLRYDPRGRFFHVVDFGHHRIVRLDPDDPTLNNP